MKQQHNQLQHTQPCHIDFFFYLHTLTKSCATNAMHLSTIQNIFTAVPATGTESNAYKSPSPSPHTP
jgi:hypothetical protein